MRKSQQNVEIKKTPGCQWEKELKIPERTAQKMARKIFWSERIRWIQNYEEPQDPRSKCRQRANKPIVRPSDNWIKVIIEFPRSKIENLVSIDWSQREIATFLKFYKGNNSKLNWPNFFFTKKHNSEKPAIKPVLQFWHESFCSLMYLNFIFFTESVFEGFRLLLDLSIIYLYNINLMSKFHF